MKQKDDQDREESRKPREI